jgi:DNA-directed RNA polymerase sigma subunit (sigma70/sigma32)
MGDPMSFISEDGWAYPDDDELDMPVEPVDPASEVDDDLVALHALPWEALIDLTDTERTVIACRFGFDGQPPRTLAQLHEHLHQELGMSRHQVRVSLTHGLDKLRAHLGH